MKAKCEPNATSFVKVELMRVEVPAAFGDALLLVSRAWFVASGFAVFVLVFVAFHRTLEPIDFGSPSCACCDTLHSQLEDGKPRIREVLVPVG